MEKAFHQWDLWLVTIMVYKPNFKIKAKRGYDYINILYVQYANIYLSVILTREKYITEMVKINSIPHNNISLNNL